MGGPAAPFSGGLLLKVFSILFLLSVFLLACQISALSFSLRRGEENASVSLSSHRLGFRGAALNLDSSTDSVLTASADPSVVSEDASLVSLVENSADAGASQSSDPATSTTPSQQNASHGGDGGSTEEASASVEASASAEAPPESSSETADSNQEAEPESHPETSPSEKEDHPQKHSGEAFSVASSRSASYAQDLLSTLSSHPKTAKSHMASESTRAGRRLLEELLLNESICRELTQALIVVDGGSSKTQPSLFTVTTESCPRQGRRVIEGTLKLVKEGPKSAGVRDLLEDWLNKHAGPDWESRELDAATLMKSFPSMQAMANELAVKLLADVTELLEKSLSSTQKEEVKVLGIPIFFHSTAGVRGFPDWYRDGMFVALRRAINSAPSNQGYVFFTNEEWTRPISGEYEGIYAFLTANFLTRNFDKLVKAVSAGDDDAELSAHRKLAGVVEVGGASMQIVFPVRAFFPPPPFVKISNLQKEGFLPGTYPPVELVAVSFMQLGASSASGIFLKMLCSKEEYLKNGICQNPCLFRGFEQDCSAGEVTIDSSGAISVSHDVRKNRLKPVATFCGGGNAEIIHKVSNGLECMATNINPLDPLERRLEIPGCTKIVGTGEFDKCVSEVDEILINPKLPLPANQEAVSIGFETPGQIFKFVSSSSPLFMTGNSLVMPVKLLQKQKLLPEDFNGARPQLYEAAERLCSTPVTRDRNGKPIVQVKGSNEEPVQLNTFTYETCHRLAMAIGVLTHINSGARRPNSVRFESNIASEDGVSTVGNFGWQVGTILHHVTRRQEWSRAAYELGMGHTFIDRQIGMHPEEEKKLLEEEEKREAEAEKSRGFPVVLPTGHSAPRVRGAGGGTAKKE
ncbi:gda1 cd39 (nucleoside phosphatase) family protein [Cystoisospora suis]|uniref:Gda1 cd39 (Nucleoside phosphatase) family protein n=1 Tax=Cystoisospora suis TaxID=483139 RepID=A0A2C6L8A4_9APIC|nr:gda1 cd39 (nucleoside phosphatase) family protein [Cystoisospora suis]